MESFLHELSGDGRLESEGVFTLDVRKARSKLAEFQLVSGQQFPDFLIATAVSSGSTILAVESGTRGIRRRHFTRIVFGGWSLEDNDLQLLAYGHIEGDAAKKRALNYLRIALSALITKAPVQISTRDKTGERGVLVDGEGAHPLDTVSMDDVPNCCVVLETQLDFETTIRDRFEFRAKWSPIDLRCNSELFLGGMSVADNWQHFEGYLLVEKPGAPLALVGSEYARRRVASSGSDGGAKFLALVEKEHPSLEIVVDGIPYPAPESFRLPYVTGYLVSDRVNRDISYQGVVEDGELESLRKEFREGVIGLLEGIASRPEALEGAVFKRLRRLLLELGEEFDLAKIEQGLLRRTGSIVATTDPASFELLLWKLPRATPKEQERVFTDFARAASSAWLSGLNSRALDNLVASTKCREALGQSERHERMLMDMIASSWSGKAADNLGDLTTAYLSFVEGWAQESVVEVPSSLRAERVDESWLVPFQLFERLQEREFSRLLELFEPPAPQWLVLLKIVTEDKMEQAWAYLVSSELFTEDNCENWCLLFDWHFRAKVSWSEAVRLRGRLAQFRVRLGRPVGQIVDAILSGAHDEPDRWGLEHHFWPRLYWLIFMALDRTPGWEVKYRLFWQEVLPQRVLLNAFFTDIEAGPLSRPLLLGRLEQSLFHFRDGV